MTPRAMAAQLEHWPIERLRVYERNGTELSPAYSDVAVRRMVKALDCTAVLAGTNQTFEEVAAERGVPVGPPVSRYATDARSIRHKNGMPYYGPRKRRQGEKQPCPK